MRLCLELLKCFWKWLFIDLNGAKIFFGIPFVSKNYWKNYLNYLSWSIKNIKISLFFMGLLLLLSIFLIALFLIITGEPDKIFTNDISTPLILGVVFAGLPFFYFAFKYYSSADFRDALK